MLFIFDMNSCDWLLIVLSANLLLSSKCFKSLSLSISGVISKLPSIISDYLVLYMYSQGSSLIYLNYSRRHFESFRVLLSKFLEFKESNKINIDWYNFINIQNNLIIQCN